MESIEVLLISQIKKAMLGSLTFEEFYNNIPNPKDLQSSYKKIYLDIEDAIEHYPSTFWSNKPLHEQFMKSGIYEKLKSDLEILERKNISKNDDSM